MHAHKSVPFGLSVTDLADLRSVHVAPLNEGTLAWVDSEDSYFVLQLKNGLADDGISIISPLGGSPSAGATAARWLRLSSAAAGGAPFVYYVERTTDFLLLPKAIGAVFLTLPVVVTRDGGSMIVEFTGSFLLTLSALSSEGMTAHLFIDGILVPRASAQETFQSTTDQEVEQRTVAIQKKLTGLALGAHSLDIRIDTGFDTSLANLPASSPDLYNGSLLAYEVLP